VGVIEDVENKTSNLCSCSWIFVLSNEHGCADPEVAPYEDEIFEIVSSPLSVYRRNPNDPIAFFGR
jgi:hypothetical protein